MSNTKTLAICFLLFSSIIVKAQHSQEVYIDQFEKENSQSLLNTDWFTFTDKINQGGSTIDKSYVKTDSKNQAIRFSYHLKQGQWQWAPYAAMACNLTLKQVPPGIKAIAYEFKGKEHSFIFRNNSVKDFGFYQKLIPESNEWTTVTIPISALEQPHWAKSVVFNETDLNALVWQVAGKSNDSGEVMLDNIRLLYTPQILFGDNSEGQTISIGHTEFFHSQLLNEDRGLSIYLPMPLAQMKAGNKKYPVVYLLDGDAHIRSLASMIGQLGPGWGNNILPEMIIVGIHNTDRWRDLTPSHADKSPFEHEERSLPRSGGGPQFIKFLEKELIPHIDSIYPTDSYKIFVGHSFGGLTVLNTLIHAPHIFNAYLSIDPSLWWNDQLLNKQAEQILPKLDLHHKKLFIATANNMYNGVDTTTIRQDTSITSLMMRNNFEFCDLLKKYSSTGLTWKNVYYPYDNHVSVPFIAQYDGFRYFFDFNQIDFGKQLMKDDNFNADVAFTVHYKKASEAMGYEIKPPETFINDYGYTFLKNKKYSKALELFSMNARNYPNSVNAWDSLGECYEAMNDKQKAIESYTKALSIKEWPYTRKKLTKLKNGQ